MALAAATVWEVRTTGSDTNGGGFVAGATGTDYSQQAAAQYALTNGVTNGTTTIATVSAAADMVGNIVYVQGGTGSVAAGWYQITAQSLGVSITVDRSTGLTAGTGVTLNIGGALATIGRVSTLMVASNKAFVKATATYTQTATVTVAATVTVSNSGPFTRLIGYTTTRGDALSPTIQLATNTGLSALKSTGSGVSFENFIINCASLGTSIGVELTGLYSRARNIKVSLFTSAGVKCSNSFALAEDCEVTGGTSAATGGAVQFTTGGPNTLIRSNIHDNACPGVVCSNGATLSFNLIFNNTGASSDGVQFSYGCLVANNTVYANGRHGLSGNGANTGVCSQVRNNILVNNGGYGLQYASSAGFPADPDYDGNAYFNNTSGTRNFADDTTVNPQDGVSPYVNVFDKILTGSPFTNAAGGDFTLNNTASAGASCRGGGTPGALPGISQLGYIDMGALQHQDSGGSSVFSVQVTNAVILNRFGVAGY